MNIKVKKLSHYKGGLPLYQTTGSSGFDVRAQISADVIIPAGGRKIVPIGLEFNIPEGFELQVRPRSGFALNYGITVLNTPGTIDADFRGEVMVILINHGELSYTIRDQDRIAQLVLAPVYKAEFEVCETLVETARGSSGFGSTGS